MHSSRIEEKSLDRRSKLARNMPEEEMRFWKKSMVPTKKSTVIIFTLAIALMLVTYLVTQSVVMKIELHDFTAAVQADTRENLVSAKNLLDGMVADLENTAAQILKYEHLRTPEARAVLDFSHKMNLFDVTFVADTEGNAYNHSGYEFSVADQEFFLRAMEEKEVVFSEILPSQRFGAIQIIAYPLFSDENNMEGVLFGLFAVETFSHLINTVVDSEKNIYIVDSNGIYINCFDESHTGVDHGNFWEELDSRQLRDITIPELKESFRSGKEGGFYYSDHQLHTNRYGYHMPLGVQDWQIVLTVEEAVVNSHIQSIRHVDSIDLIMDTICLTTMLLCVYSYFKKTNSEIIKVNQEITKNNQMLQMAVEHTNHIIFEYDIPTKKIELKTGIPNSPFKGSTILQIPEGILKTNVISESSIAALKTLFETIENKQSCQTDLQIIRNNGEMVWYRVRMYNLYNETGSIVGTVGSAEDINMLKKGEAAIKRRDEMYKSFLANALLYARVNLNTAMVTELNGREIQMPYETYLKKIIDEHVCVEYHSYVAQALSLDLLRDDYQQGKEFIEVQCTIKTQQGPKWVSCLVYRVHMSDRPKVTFLIRDIDEKKRQEIVLKEQAERDGLTGLYNAATTRSKINEVLSSQRTSQRKHIFILFDLDNFKQINDTFGHAHGDQALIEVSNVLQHRYPSSSIIGRLGGDEFVLMLLDVRSDKYTERIMRELKNAVTKDYIRDGLTVTLSASIGAALAPAEGSTFEELYRKADKALYQVKKEGKNGYKRYK